MNNLAFDLESLFRSLIARMQEEGVFEHEAYDDLVEEMIQEKIDSGDLTTDDDTGSMIDDLKMRWPEAEASLNSGHDQDILDGE